MDQIIDTNVTLFHWPFRRMPGDETNQLVEKLRSNGVVEAWAGSFEGVFHRDLTAANERLKKACDDAGKTVALIPFGSINPLLPDWEPDLKSCVEQFGMRGIRLHPNYHGYKLDHPEFVRLLALADERRLMVQIVATLEDERTQPKLMQVPHVDLKPLAELLKPHARLQVVLLNAFRALTIDQAGSLAASGQVFFDIAMLEGVGGIARLAAKVPTERIVFGSHYPLFYFESALFKLRESALAQVQRDLIFTKNARGLTAQ
ncbi:MAG: rane-bound dehydrogenase domain protein [Planctomycetaceae bacterium]|nr:rane-bound dehydrogenase domain protein [Planctomycetaceae bacterium]